MHGVHVESCFHCCSTLETNIRLCATCVHVMWLLGAGGPGPLPAHCCRSVYFCKLAGTWDFLCVRRGGSSSKQHGPSGLPAAPVTGVLVLLQTSCWGQNSVQTNPGSQTMVHWSPGKTSTVCINVGRLMLPETCLQTCFSSTYIKCQWISQEPMDYLEFRLSHSWRSLT